MADPVKPVAPPAGSVTLYDKETSAPVVVDAADAPAHILSGRLNYAPGTRVPVSINGKVGTVDADELGDAVAKGAKPTTATAFHAAEQQQKYGGTGGAAAALGINALDSATLGASNALIGGVGGKGAREYMRGVTEENPSAATAGDVLGFVAPVVADVVSGGALTPGIAAAEGARLAERGLVRGAAEAALLGPTRVMSRAGALAESAARAVVGRNAEGAAARVAQNIIAGGARGVVEGGIAGFGQEVGKQYLQDDPDLSGEALGSAWVHGALVGGALGGVLHGVGGMLTKKAPKGLASAVDRVEMGAEEGSVSKAAAKESTFADAAAKQIISQVDDPEKAKLLEDAWKHKSFEGHDNMLVEASRKVRGSLDEAVTAANVVDRASFGESKSNQIRKLVPAENAKLAQKAAMETWAQADDVVKKLEEQTMKGGAEGSVKRLRKWLDDFGDMSDSAEWKDPAALFDKIDDFKRRIGKEAGFGRGVHGREEATNAFNALYEQVRTGLENESTWGAAAVAQKDINLATANMIDTNGKFLQRFTTQYGSEALTGAPKYIADSAKVDGFIKGLTSVAKDTDVRMTGDYIAKRSRFLDAVTKNYDLPAEALKAVAAERASLKAMSETIASTSNEVSRVNQLKSIMAEERGHSIHGIIGMALDAVTKPGISLARLAELEALKGRTLAKVDKGFASIKSALSGSKPGLAPSLETHETFEKRRASLLHVASKPDEVQAHLTGTASPMASHAPATAQAFQRASMRTVQYLMTALPKPAPRAGSLTPQVDMEAWQPSDQQKNQFNRQYDMATHPEHALALVANGTITPQHVEALKATRPAMYEAQAKKLDALLRQQTKPVPFHMQAPLKTFLGLPQMDPETQKLMQANYATKGPQAPGLNKPMKMADTTTLNATKEKL